jgi:hypothetical protein
MRAGSPYNKWISVSQTLIVALIGDVKNYVISLLLIRL